MWFLWVAGAFGGLYLYAGNREPFFFILTASPIIWFGGRALFSHTKKTVTNSIAEKRDEKEWRKNLNRRAEKERVLGSARNQPVIELMREQAENLIEVAPVVCTANPDY